MSKTVKCSECWKVNKNKYLWTTYFSLFQVKMIVKANTWTDNQNKEGGLKHFIIFGLAYLAHYKSLYSLSDPILAVKQVSKPVISR